MMCVIAKAARPEKHKVLPLCEGDTQEASRLSRMRGWGVGVGVGL